MTIFWRTFLSFWIATAAILAIVFSSSEPVLLHHLRNPSYRPVTTTLPLADALTAYETGGEEAFTSAAAKVPAMGDDVLLYDADGQALSHIRGRERVWSPLAQSCASVQTPVLERRNARVAVAMPVKSPSGRAYVIVFTTVKPVRSRFFRLQFWTKLSISMIPVSLICWALSLYISRPLRHLQTTVQRMAAGDLASRPPKAELRRTDELGALSRDVDTMARRIEELLTAQRRFVANVAHELSAPITRLQLALALLEREAPPASSESATQIEREIDRLSDLVQELLFLASLENASAVATEDLVKVSLEALCEEVLRDNRAELEECSCSVHDDFSPVTIRAAPQALRRAIENVLRNAIRYCPEHSVIQFRCSPSVSSDTAEIEISDSGEGVPPSMLTSIFEPFVRAVPSKAGKEGTGLGLAIAAEAVTLHGGTIRAENRPGGGLRVIINLPQRNEYNHPS